MRRTRRGRKPEDSVERGFLNAADPDDQGRSDELDLDNIADIADEGPGRRG